MKLLAWYKNIPRSQRVDTMRRFAKAHGIAEITARTWIGQLGGKRHPATHLAWLITEDFTGGKVTRYDERPDVYGNK